MAYLLDTHALIWWWDEDGKLSAAARGVMSDRAAAVFVSAITAFETANKLRHGKLDEMAEAVDGGNFSMWVERDGFSLLSLQAEHGILAGRLPGEHRDPFDRMLAAQSIVDDLTVITCDPALAAFGCRTLW